MFKIVQILIIWHIKLRTVEMITIVCVYFLQICLFSSWDRFSPCRKRRVSCLQRTNTRAEFLQNIIYSRCKTNMYFEICVNTKEINFCFEMLLPPWETSYTKFRVFQKSLSITSKCILVVIKVLCKNTNCFFYITFETHKEARLQGFCSGTFTENCRRNPSTLSLRCEGPCSGSLYPANIMCCFNLTFHH